MSQHISTPEMPAPRHDPRKHRYADNFLEAFRSGWDTNRIASVYQVAESEVYNALAHARGQKTEAGPRRRRTT